MKYGIIDIGSNTIRLIIYLVDEDKNITRLNDKKYVAGLASYIKKGFLTKKGADKLVSVLNKLYKLCDTFGVDKVYPFATASLRNIKNSDEIVKFVEDNTGREIDLVSGKEEARLGYLGIKNDFDMKSGYIFDIGGGSTEITLIENGQVASSVSLNIGSLSLYKDYANGIIPKKSEAVKMQAKVLAHLKKCKIVRKKNSLAYGIGGTIRACGNVSMELFDLPNAKELDRDILNDLYQMMIEEKKSALTKTLQVNPARIHTITPGMIILRELMKYFNLKTLYISDNGAREGYLSKILE